MNFPSKPSPCVGIRTCSDYSPFGVELDGRTVSLEGYRFGYQGSEKDNEFKGNGNSYTTEFRQLDPRLGRWLSVDPVVKEHRSPYDVLSNNPIIMVDPNGDDDYKVDRKGNLKLKKSTNDDYDKIIGKSKNGLRKSIKIEKEILLTHSNYDVSSETFVLSDNNENVQETLFFKVDTYTGSSKETQKLFEFMAITTDVEWSLYKFNKDGDYPYSILTTSHNESKDVSGRIIIQNNEFFTRTDFNGHDHIHPNGKKTPSGYTDYQEEKNSRKGDVGFARSLMVIFSDKDLVFRIYTKPKNIIKKGVYTEYNDSTYYDNLYEN